MKVSKNFVIQEFVYPELYKQFGDKSIWFINPKIVELCQYMRNKLDKSITINNWHIGGQYKESGLRAFDTPTGGKLSQHKFGNAVDIKVDGLHPADIFDFIKKEWNALHILGLTTIEDISYTKSWNHLDCRNTMSNELLIVKP